MAKNKNYRQDNESLLDFIKRKHNFRVADNGCWECDLRRDKDGYAKIKIKRKHLRLHRVMYEEMVEKIPEGMIICHKCDNPSCFNPEHLFVGTHKDNAIDKVNKKRYKDISGENNPMVTLNSITVYNIKFNENGEHKEIASKYNTTVSVVGKIKRNERWKHITEDYFLAENLRDNNKEINHKIIKELMEGDNNAMQG